MLAVRLQHIVQYSLHLVGLRSQRVDEQRLVGRVPITMDGCLDGQQLVGLDRGQQPEAGGRQRRRAAA